MALIMILGQLSSLKRFKQFKIFKLHKNFKDNGTYYDLRATVITEKIQATQVFQVAQEL